MYKKSVSTKIFAVLMAFMMIFASFGIKNEVNAQGEISVAEARQNNTGNKTVRAYIIGTVSSGANLETSNFVKTNLMVADDPNETDVNKMMPVQLPKTSLRSDWNLVDNPSNLGKKVDITGDLMKYFNVPGIKNTSSIVEVADGGNPGGATNEAITIPEAQALDKNGQVVKVVGYIMGQDKNGKLLNEIGVIDSVYNILIADSPDETDTSKMLKVQLQYKTDPKTYWNVMTNPDVIGRQIYVTGTLSSDVYYPNGIIQKTSTIEPVDGVMPTLNITIKFVDTKQTPETFDDITLIKGYSTHSSVNKKTFPTPQNSETETFKNWATKNEDGTFKYANPATVFFTDTTLYAQYDVTEPTMYDVTYNFVSASQGRQLPNEVLALLPSAEKVEKGKEYTPNSPSQLNVEVQDGNWSFVGYSPEKVANLSANQTFVGTWEFTEKKPQLTSQSLHIHKILQEELKAITDDEAKTLEHLEGVTFQLYKKDDVNVDENGNFLSLRNNATAILTNTTEKQADGTYAIMDVSTGDKLKAGQYWLIENHRQSTYKGQDGKELAAMLGVPMLLDLPIKNNEGQVVEVVDLYPKNTVSKPEIEKTILEEKEYKVNDEVQFNVKATINANAKYGLLKVVDTMTDGLQLVDNTVEIKSDNLEITQEDYEIVKDEKAFSIEFTQAGLDKILAKVNGGQNLVINISYKAKVTEAALTATVVKNDAKIQYANNPDTEINAVGASAVVNIAKVGGAKFIKLNEDKAALKGAEFVVLNADGKYLKSIESGVEVWAESETEAKVYTSDDKGEFMVEGLLVGAYKLKETKAPEGYAVLKNQVEFEAKADYMDGQAIEIINYKLFLPQTGGNGTLVISLVGLAVISVFTGLYIKRKSQI